LPELAISRHGVGKRTDLARVPLPPVRRLEPNAVIAGIRRPVPVPSAYDCRRNPVGERGTYQHGRRYDAVLVNAGPVVFGDASKVPAHQAKPVRYYLGHRLPVRVARDELGGSAGFLEHATGK
jgi:hypothetical protein